MDLKERVKHIPPHPGEYVREYINIHGVDEFKNIEIHTFDSFVKEEIGVSENLARQLEEATGVDVETWMLLQQRYDEAVGL